LEALVKILLICAAGMSTSLVVKKIKEIAPEGTIIEYGTGAEVVQKIKDFDVVLAGPQLRYKKDQLLKLAEENNVPIDFIDPVTYGRIMADNIYQQALDTYERGKR